ncbi:hypothetical protein CYY_007294 [Polysphondylium violaceum]|uniref:Uncharacterized protein n=1 Tax=Polysphondylium violaceum TaxID=133409 RepID=A0A8J4PPW2_9MYCE|nr:hypothetical protein CYY_007294 [Polysphondylium violaceum]
MFRLITIRVFNDSTNNWDKFQINSNISGSKNIKDIKSLVALKQNLNVNLFDLTLDKKTMIPLPSNTSIESLNSNEVDLFIIHNLDEASSSSPLGFRFSHSFSSKDPQVKIERDSSDSDDEQEKSFPTPPTTTQHLHDKKPIGMTTPLTDCQFPTPKESEGEGNDSTYQYDQQQQQQKDEKQLDLGVKIYIGDKKTLSLPNDSRWDDILFEFKKNGIKNIIGLKLKNDPTDFIMNDESYKPGEYLAIPGPKMVTLRYKHVPKVIEIYPFSDRDDVLNSFGFSPNMFKQEFIKKNGGEKVEPIDLEHQEEYLLHTYVGVAYFIIPIL